MKKIFAIISVSAAVLAFAPGLRAQLNSAVVTDKYVEGPDPSGRYTLTLETYVTGKVAQEAIEVPADIIIAMDYSGSMKKTGGYDYPDFNAAVTKKVEAPGVKNSTNQGWTYSGIKYGNSTGTKDYQWSYLDADGTYYPVRRANNLVGSDGSTKNVRAIWIVKNGKRWYLRGTSLNEDYDRSKTKDTHTLYTGTLYKGWRYVHKKDDGTLNNDSPYWGINYGGTGGVSNNEWFYKHTDGKYYPVRRSNTLADASGGNAARALWVVIDGVTKYLTCSGLADDYDHTITSDGISLCFMTLYKGWTDATITAVTTDYGVAGASGGYYYKHTDNKCYPLKKEQLTGNMVYQTYFIADDGKKYYLNGDGASLEPFPYSKGTKISLYFGNLYTVKTVKAFSKYEGLRRAVTGFIDALYVHSSEHGGLQHRIALEAWGSGVWYCHDDIKKKKGQSSPTGSGENTGVTYGNSAGNSIKYKISYPNMKECSASDKDCQTVRLLKDFRNIMNTTERNQLINEFAKPPKSWQKSSDPRWGMYLASKLFDREGRAAGKNYNDVNDIEDYEKSQLSATDAANYWGTSTAPARPKILILISDGQFNGYNKSGDLDGDSSTDSWYPASDSHSKKEISKAIEYANSLKNKGVIIYDIHVNTKAVNDNERAIASGPDYVLTATNYTDELLAAMLSIVQDIQGADIDLGSNAVVQDVATSEFSVPGDASDILVYTSDCTGVVEAGSGSGDDDDDDEGEGGDVSGAGTLIFSDTLVPFDAVVTKEVKSDGTTSINVTNFDFAANWCGKHARADHSTYYAGKKLVIKIPIVPDENLVGGKVFTNTTQSVVFDGDENTVQNYPRPQVGPFPVHLKIAKQGLLEGDSAVFAIYRKPVESEDESSGGSEAEEESSSGSGTTPDVPAPEAEWETTPYMTVILTGNAAGTEVTTDIENLDPGYYYKIVETSWSWLYEPDVKERDTQSQTKNPFRFINTPKDEDVKAGEDVKRNRFWVD